MDDPFEIHMQLLGLLKRLTASAASIHNVVGFLVRYQARCADDLWETVLDECHKGTLNTRINILYLLDSLLTTLLDLPTAPRHQQDEPSSSTGAPPVATSTSSYSEWLERDLTKIVEWVVPKDKAGLLNLWSARQILDSWRSKRLLSVPLLDSVLDLLEGRRNIAHEEPPIGRESDKKRSRRNGVDAFTPQDKLRRMEEDRERHKRVREKLWVLPLPSPLSTTLPPTAAPLPFPRLASLLPSSTSPQSLSTPSDLAKSPSTSSITPQSPFTSSPSYGAAHPSAGANRSLRGNGVGLEGPIDREFDRAWDEVEEWDVVDLDLCKEQNVLCFPHRFSVSIS